MSIKKESEFTHVVCIKIDEKFTHHKKLVIGKTYQAYNDFGDRYYISELGDGKAEFGYGGIGYYSPQLFVSIEKYREMQLEKLGL